MQPELCYKCGKPLNRVASTPQPVQNEPPPAPREFPPLSSSNDFDYWCFACAGWSRPKVPDDLHVVIDHDKGIAEAFTSEAISDMYLPDQPPRQHHMRYARVRLR